VVKGTPEQLTEILGYDMDGHAGCISYRKPTENLSSARHPTSIDPFASKMLQLQLEAPENGETNNQKKITIENKNSLKKKILHKVYKI
jgi:hypothetical protein